MSATGETPIPTSKPGTPSNTVTLPKVLIVVLPVFALIAIAILAVLRYGNIEAMMRDFTQPGVVHASGEVTFAGKPLPNAQVMTEPVNGRGLPAIGGTDDQGKFTLMTDIRGAFTDGATVGEHRVTVSARENVSVPGGPPLITPKEYDGMETTPLRIVVSSDPAKNEFKLVLEGQPNPPSGIPTTGMPAPSRPGSGKAGKGGRGGPRGGGRGGPPAGAPAESPPAGSANPESGTPAGTPADATKTDSTAPKDETPSGKSDNSKSEGDKPETP